MRWLKSKRMKLDRRKQQIRLKLKMRKLARRKQQQRPNVILGKNNRNKKMQIDQGDYQILKALYENQLQYRFCAKYGFGVTMDVLSMIKVRKNDTHKRIFHLRLRAMSLPRCILQLDALESLSITINGRLPRRIGQLKNLKKLVIYSQTPQALPEELGELSNLETLRVTADFVTFPSSLSRLPKFEELFLNIYHSPNNIEFQTLKHLEFRCRDELPPSVCNLCHLEHLDLAYSTIRYLPEEIGNLENLQILDLNHSKITELPRSIGKLQNLKTLNLDFTRNLGTLPVEIGGLGQLQNLFLLNRKFESLSPEQIPSTIFNLKNLERLHLSWPFYIADRLTNFEMLSRLVSEFPHLGIIESRENWTLVAPSRNPRLAHSLMCNRINTKLYHGDASPNSRYDHLISNLKLWPFILEQLDRTFRTYTTASSAGNTERFENPDAMYYLITNHLPYLLEAVKKNAKPPPCHTIVSVQNIDYQ